LIFVNHYIGKHFGKAIQNTGHFRVADMVLQVYTQANTNNMESHGEDYITPKSHALAALLQLEQQLESAFIRFHVNILRKVSFGCGSMMIQFLSNISKDSPGPNFVCNQNTIEKKVCHQQHTSTFQLGSLLCQHAVES
jgi:hypothetical protein